MQVKLALFMPFEPFEFIYDMNIEKNKAVRLN